MAQTPTTTEAPKAKGMNMKVLAVIIVVILVVVGVGVYFLTKPPTTGGSNGPQITIKDDGLCQTQANCYFTPTPTNGNVSITVTWNNAGTAGHTVTSCDSTNGSTSTECPTMNASGLDTFNLSVQGGHSVVWTFKKAGTYYYYCAIHPWMHGEIIVS